MQKKHKQEQKKRSLDPTQGLSFHHNLTGYEGPERERPTAANDFGPSVGDMISGVRA